jgi:hypothetical protein
VLTALLPAEAQPLASAEGATLMTTDFEVGVRLFSAKLSMGTSTLVSGK